MRNFQLVIGHTNHINSTSLYGISSKQMHQADLIFTHIPGMNYHGHIIKCRFKSFDPIPLIPIDNILHLFNHLPRKQKKLRKQQITQQIQQYKDNY